MQPTTGRPARAPFRQLSIVPLALLLLLAACSTSGSSGVATIDRGGDADGEGSPTQTPAAETDFEDAYLAYTACMRENGVNMPDPEPVVSDDSGGQGVQRLEERHDELPDPESEEFQQADEACRQHMEGFAIADGFGEDEVSLTEEEQEALLELTECMRDNGINIPDPGQDGVSVDISTGEAPEPADEGFDWELDEEKLRAAQEACREYADKLPQGDEVAP